MPDKKKNLKWKERVQQGETLYRTLQIREESINEEERTVELSFSSETPILTYGEYEILGHSAGEVDFSRMEISAPVLLDHDRRTQIGVVVSASVKDGKGRALVRFSRSKLGEEVFQDILDGIRTNVSVGYRVFKWEYVGSNEDGPRTYRATLWQPYEISMVSLPADTSVGVGRSENEEEPETEINNEEEGERNMPEKENQTPAPKGFMHAWTG